jgi:hypothetical protein
MTNTVVTAEQIEAAIEKIYNDALASQDGYGSTHDDVALIRLAISQRDAHIAALEADNKRLRKPAMTEAELGQEAECLASDFSAGSYDESCWGAEIFDLARRYAASQRPAVPDGVEQQIEALRQNHDSANQTNAVLIKRLASTMTELAELRGRCNAMHEAIEVYALPLIWALKCDGKLANDTTAEKVLRSVATPPYVIPALPATEGGGG